MPTVMRIDGFRVVIFTEDHVPAHVHVIGGGCEARFNIVGAELLTNFGFSRVQVRRFKAALLANRTTLLERWTEIHG